MSESATNPAAAPASEAWLADPGHPVLGSPYAARLNDRARPDRLAWNTFRTLALWNTDVWVPSMLEAACEAVNPLSEREWGEAEVELWRTGLDLDDAVDVAIDGVECFVVVEATLRADLDVDRLAAGINRALDVATADHRQAGFVVVSPGLDEPAGANVRQLLDEDRLRSVVGRRPGIQLDALARAVGWVTWQELGTLALDLGQEADTVRQDQVRKLASELQATFPGLEL